jgi:hypothetical protein
MVVRRKQPLETERRDHEEQQQGTAKLPPEELGTPGKPSQQPEV